MRRFLSSWPNRGQSPVKWGYFPYIGMYVSPPPGPASQAFKLASQASQPISQASPPASQSSHPAKASQPTSKASKPASQDSQLASQASEPASQPARRRMDGRMDGKSPHFTGCGPLSRPLPRYSLNANGKQDKGTADHMCLGD